MKSSRQTIPNKSVEDADALEELAGQFLSFLAQDSERLGHFFALTGIEPAGLRHAASQPGFVSSVVHYLVGDERLLVAFADAHGLDPAAIGRLANRLDEPENEA